MVKFKRLSGTVTEEILFVVSGIIVGFIMQFFSGRYLDYLGKNTDLLDPTNSNEHKPVIVKPDKKKFKLLDKIGILRIIRKLRGGVLDVSTILTLLQLIAETGPVIGGIGGFIVFISAVPKGKLVSNLYKSSVQNLPVKSLISIEDTRTAIETLSEMCEDDIGGILFKILTDDSLTFEDKQKIIYKILTKHIDLDTHSARIKFVLCIITVLVALYIGNLKGYIILLRQLDQAVKDRKMKNVVLHAIIRKLKKKRCLVDPYLFD